MADVSQTACLVNGLSDLSDPPKYAKVGMLGFEGSGKTATAAILAVGIKKHFNLPGPIAAHDTEDAVGYIAPYVREQTGQNVVGKKSRALGDALATIKAAVDGGVSVLIIDSVTHLWMKLCADFIVQRNEALLKAGKNVKGDSLTFDDQRFIKAQWARFSNLFLTAPIHIICCGRAGFSWDNEVNEETGKRELVKTGIKMKAEGEFGFESSLLVEMERVQVATGGGKLTGEIVHRALILKDRFMGGMTGQEATDPTFEFFKPFVSRLTGAHATVDLELQTNLAVDANGDAEWQRERRQRTIFAEEIAGWLETVFPGSGAQQKLAKQELVFEAFEAVKPGHGTRSWKQIEESTPSGILSKVLDAMKAKIAKVDAGVKGSQVTLGAQAAQAASDDLGRKLADQVGAGAKPKELPPTPPEALLPGAAKKGKKATVPA